MVIANAQNLKEVRITITNCLLGRINFTIVVVNQLMATGLLVVLFPPQTMIKHFQSFLCLFLILDPLF